MILTKETETLDVRELIAYEWTFGQEARRPICPVCGERARPANDEGLTLMIEFICPNGDGFW